MATLRKVRIYSDGSAKGSGDGPGGYGTIVQYLNKDDTVESVVEYTEGFKITTNNRMELMGVITGLESLMEPCKIEVFTDSKYVVNAFNQKWINNWESNGWKTSLNKPVKNIDLWKRLLDAKKPHKCTFTWVKGHDGHTENERCDFLAQSSAEGTVFKRNEDGILEPLSYLKDDENYNPDENTTEITFDTDKPKSSIIVLDDNVIRINGVKFIQDEDGNIGPHPDEDPKKCKETYDELVAVMKDFGSSSLSSLLFNDPDIWKFFQ